jgi:DNA-binding CsgD family transcriptional regulator
MSARLSHQQYTRLLKAIEEINSCRQLEEFPNVANREILALIRCDTVSYNDVHPAADRSVAIIHPHSPDIFQYFEAWVTYMHQHPVINYIRETGDGSAHQIADFLSREEFHALDLYRQFYGNIGVEQQLSMSMVAPNGIVVGIALSRHHRRPYSETDRLTLNLLAPHVRQTYLNLQELGHLRSLLSGLSGALDAVEEGIVLWSHQGVVLFASERARQILAREFGWRGGRSLPEPLETWGREQLRKPRGRETPLTRNAPEARFSARLSQTSEFHYTTLILELEETYPAPQNYEALGLSKREAEVLRWVAAGKSNAEIATILDIRPLTAKTHVRNILEKLGVENRTSAASRAQEFLRGK